MSKGPKNRNFNIQLLGRQTTRRRSTSGIWGSYTVNSVTGRSAYLSVDNPWRKEKPVPLTPTKRTLRVSRTTPLLGVYQERFTTGAAVETAGILSRNSDYSMSTGATLLGLYGPSARGNLATDAIVDALTKLKDQKWNAGVATAEMSGLAQMATDFMSLCNNVQSDLHDGKYERAYKRFKRWMRRRGKAVESYPRWRKRHLKDYRHVDSVRRARKIPEGWLYYHFGIAPTMSDFNGALTEFADRLYQDPWLMTRQVSGYAKNTYKAKGSTAIRSDYEPYLWLDCTSLESIRVYLRVSPRNATLAHLSKLGALNVPEALWNGLPFSWMVDYFGTFGDVLHVLDIGAGWHIHDEWVESYRRVYRCKATVKLLDDGRSSVIKEVPGTYQLKVLDRTLKKDTYGPIGRVLPRFHFGGLSAHRFANVFSVFATMFKGTVRP